MSFGNINRLNPGSFRVLEVGHDTADNLIVDEGYEVELVGERFDQVLNTFGDDLVVKVLVLGLFGEVQLELDQGGDVGRCGSDDWDVLGHGCREICLVL